MNPGWAEEEGFGSYLKLERERRAVALDQVARATKIPRKLLEHLEAEDLESLPAWTYVRGFVKSYSRYLGIDAQPALTALERRASAEAAARAAEPPPEPSGERALPLHPRTRYGVALLVLILVLVAVAAHWLAP
ncbi:MAG TPA: helix-turn-helix domain-containing protein [Polyangia bacterium]|nr:helix-turn-helix domain-containing protein [Polyangia bacterium]